MILADENVNFKIINAIREIPIGVDSIAESHSGFSDEDIIKLSRNPKRIILTEDKDFGEWVFAHKVENISVIFMRYHFKRVDEMLKIIINIINQRKEDL